MIAGADSIRSPQANSGRWSQPWSIAAVAFLLRVVAMTVLHTYRFKHDLDNFGFGWETGRIARAIAIGRGFSDPLQGHTGPTAWIAPLYPYLLAGIFKLFGIYTFASSWVCLAINSVFGALNVIPIYRIFARCFSRRRSADADIGGAAWSAWIWAAFPFAWYWSIHWQWETSLATLLLSCAFLLMLRISEVGAATATAATHTSDWTLFGITWGAIALTNPSLLTFLPFAGIWALIRRSQRVPFVTSFRPALLSGAIFLAMLTPWTIRNYEVFHKFIPIRGNFWVELHLGNTEATEGLWAWWLHPSQDPEQLALYTRLGEAGYVAHMKTIVIGDIQRDPARFWRNSVRRFWFYWYDTPRVENVLPRFSETRNLLFFASSLLGWLGVALLFLERHSARWPFFWMFVAVPFVYYLTFPHPRYRAPIEPFIVILAVHLFRSAQKRIQPRTI